MDDARREKLKAKGIVSATVEDFLGLTEVDMKVVDLKVRLAKAVRARREAAEMSQADLAGRMETTQPRVARIEANREGVSLDKLVFAFFATGGSPKDLARIVAGE